MPKKKADRVPIDTDLSARVLYDQDHTCCICRIPGKPPQLHHIDDDPSNSVYDNLAVLCLEDHNRTQIRGGFAKHLLPTEVKIYRDEWVASVKRRRDLADQLAARRMAGLPDTNIISFIGFNDDAAIISYVKTMPPILATVYSKARQRFDTGVTSEMVGGASDVISLLESMWAHLAEAYPPGHFNDTPPTLYISDYTASRWNWHANLAERYGTGQSGTIVMPIAAANVLHDMHEAIKTTVLTLIQFDEDDFDRDAWIADWDAAIQDADMDGVAS